MSGVPTVHVSDVPDPLPDGLLVLDVREPIEWSYARIDGALHIPLHDLPTRLDEVPDEGQVLVVCKVGGRSAQATMWLRQQGREAVNLAGGMIDWADAGRTMVGDHGQPQVV
jgi:rhodanese-related sulfurtransferase